MREALLFADNEEMKCLENDTIFKELKNMGYEKKSDSLKFQKGLLYPQWSFFMHTILHCLSPKTSGWNEFSTTQASAMISIALGLPFNFSHMIMEGLVKNVKGNVYVYPRFLQLIMDKQFKC